MKTILIFITGIVILGSCASVKEVAPPIYRTDQSVDYSLLDHWAAHPSKLDQSDYIPGKGGVADQSNLPIDVFFIHPTTFTDKTEEIVWNASLADEHINQETDSKPIKYQASIFNEVGKVYAPRYRQAHLRTYFHSDSVVAKRTFELAYQDVQHAFDHYIEHWNDGRPFILASHSQGTTHTIPLIKNRIENAALIDRLVAAYIVGMPVSRDQFEHLEPCENATQTNCFVSWRTYRHGSTPTPITGDHIINTNPLNWKTTGEPADKSLNKGAVLRNFNKIYTERVDAQSVNGMLWAHRPKFPFSFLLNTENYHIVDYNFYYMNIKENAALRSKTYMEHQ